MSYNDKQIAHCDRRRWAEHRKAETNNLLKQEHAGYEEFIKNMPRLRSPSVAARLASPKAAPNQGE
jgi:hypothetical protein